MRHCPVIVLLVLLPLSAACTPAAAPASGPRPGSCGLDLPADITPKQAIWTLVGAESRLVVSQQIEPLMALWADDASITDAQHTAGDATDDQAWKGADAIRLRYLRGVFPSAPGSARPKDLRVTISGDRATARGTTGIGDEESPAGDLWELAFRDGCWVIVGLTYNLEQ